MTKEEWIKAAEELFRKAESEGIHFSAEENRQGIPGLYAWIPSDGETHGTLVQTECFNG